ncbi:hypothetical protein I9W82_002517 [Candida metapsilosis]|uniref:Uncharacterized protein n=1 Tax=Candida metapsilosis TaxID=273372 RepID=A0A8H8DE37_9ASCO|nr:hypothetical protein I9W82_002517 [Candida metapsilosis]
MPPAKIPGYYFDESRGRYFKITNGAVTTSDGSSQKYHNNAVQAEKRSQHFDKVEKQNQNKQDKLTKKKRRGEEVIRNPHVKPFPSSEKLDQRLRQAEFDHLSFLSLKAGAVDLSSVYYKGDIVGAVKCGAKITLTASTPPQGKIVAYHKDYFIMSRNRIGEEESLNLGVFTYTGELHVAQQSVHVVFDNEYLSLTRELAFNIFDPYNIREFMTPQIYSGYNSFDAKSDILQIYTLSGHKFCIVVKFHTYSNNIAERFQDLTLPLMKFLKSQFSKLNKKSRKLSRAFGLDSFEFVGPSKSSIEEINAMIKSGANDASVRARLNSFLSTHDNVKPKYAYRPLDKDVPNPIKTCTIVEGRIVIVTLDGQIIYFEYDHRSKKFQKFKLFTTQLVMTNPLVRLVGEFIYVSTGKEILIINHEDKQIERHAFDGLRKFFILSPTRWIIVNKNQICYYDPCAKKLDLIMSYNNGNDVHQQFEVINNHLIFNIGAKVQVMNLSRAITDQSAIMQLQFETYKLGYFKHFKLHRILDMGEEHGLTRVGFQFADNEERHTRFEAYCI